MKNHYCYYDFKDVTGISDEDCKKWHGKEGAMQVNTQMEVAFQKFAREMKYLCEKSSMHGMGWELVGQHLWDHISVPYVLKLTPESDDLCCTIKNSKIPTVNIDGKIYDTRKLSNINDYFSWIMHLRSNLNHWLHNMSDIQIYAMENSKFFDETGSLCTAPTAGHNDLKEYAFSGDKDDTVDSDDLNEGTIRIIDQFSKCRGSINAVTANIFDKPKLACGWTNIEDGIPTKNSSKCPNRHQIRMLRDMFYWQ
ncbi:unnamed protein product [Mytilus coruscus]|uniref:Uncharacterized protein n=1 Tax=Mytilus coruscus TaxID=42192 RepID=A0A6J8DQR9_MYTCO|nr:unnamed protein product [Mytilus coruscus]